jgi:hypothetical protein
MSLEVVILRPFVAKAIFWGDLALKKTFQSIHPSFHDARPDPLAALLILRISIVRVLPLVGGHHGFAIRKPCYAIEKAACMNNAVMIFSLGIFFLLLTIRNRDKPEKRKRLAYFAIYCTIANLTGLLMIGASSVTGLMNTTEQHVVYVFGDFDSLLCLCFGSVF